ncbi:hypothetical protein PM082_011365 [Marasmius tenuissimus]|nr:hypothetical protein PM082_011365 [Marasmius tenuissimus]
MRGGISAGGIKGLPSTFYSDRTVFNVFQPMKTILNLMIAAVSSAVAVEARTFTVRNNCDFTVWPALTRYSRIRTSETHVLITLPGKASLFWSCLDTTRSSSNPVGKRRQKRQSNLTFPTI